MPAPYAEPGYLYTRSNSALATLGTGATPSQKQAAAASAAVAALTNRVQGTRAAGFSVPPGGTAVQAIITPATTGKVRVSVSVAGSIDAPIHLLLTKQTILGPLTNIFSWPNTNSGGWVSLSTVMEVDGLAIGLATTFKAVTTLPDGNLALGNGVDGVGAVLLVEELP
jgi:hypothetical protein